MVAVDALDLEQVLPVLEGNFERIGQALFDTAVDRQAVHHHFDRMAMGLVKLEILGQFAHLAVDLDPHEPGAAQLAQLLAVLALAVAHDRREHVQARPLGPTHDLIDDLLHALSGDFAPAVVAERMTGAGKQQAQVIVDLGDRADRGAGIARGGLLFDRNRGRQAFDRIDLRLLHLLQELARIRGQRLHVAPLAFGIDGVEGQRGLPRPGDAGDYDQAVARDLEVEILEVVLARALDCYAISHCGLPSGN